MAPIMWTKAVPALPFNFWGKNIAPLMRQKSQLTTMGGWSTHPSFAGSLFELPPWFTPLFLSLSVKKGLEERFSPYLPYMSPKSKNEPTMNNCERNYHLKYIMHSKTKKIHIQNILSHSLSLYYRTSHYKTAMFNLLYFSAPLLKSSHLCHRPSRISLEHLGGPYLPFWIRSLLAAV